MNVVSLFAGIGGFDLAFERSGASVTTQVEINPQCQILLLHHFPKAELHDDVRNIGRVDADLICGGFPCQDISLAGRRAGLAGERSGLWWEFARILEQSQPEWCLIENVAGLLSSNGGRDLGAILSVLGEIGYGFAYRVLDAQFFGVPQRRRRVFIVGCLGDARRAAEILLEPEGGCWNPPTRREAGEEVAGTLAARTTAGGYPGTDESLSARVDRGGVNSEGADNHLIPQTFDWQVAGSGRTWIHDAPGGPSRSLTASKTLAVMGDISHGLTASAGGRGGVSEDGTGRGVPVVGGLTGVRKLLPVECERLQGFPDGWTEGHADTTRYRMLGNAVAVPVIEWIAQRLMAVA